MERVNVTLDSDAPILEPDLKLSTKSMVCVFPRFWWSTCVAIKLRCIQYDGGFLPDTKLLTLCY